MVAGEERSHMESDIRNVVFDFGGVLVHWNVRSALMSRYSLQTIAEFDSSETFRRANAMGDLGEPLDKVVTFVREEGCNLWGDMMQWYIDHFRDAIEGEMPGARQLVADVQAAGCHVYGLSNWSMDTFRLVRDSDALPALHLLEDMVISGDVRQIKPHRDIYETALTRFGIEAGQSAFIDDHEENVEAAEAVGFHGILAHGSTGIRRDLIRLGVDLPRLIAGDEVEPSSEEE